MLKVSSNVKANVEEEYTQEGNNLNDFKGLYYNDNQEQRYYEGGAHFSYKDLCNRLERIVLNLGPDRRGKSMYEEDFENSTIRRNEDVNSSYAKTKANSRKFGSDNSRETLIERNSSSKLSKFLKTSNNITNSNHVQSRNNSVNMNNNINISKSINTGMGMTGNNAESKKVNIMKTYSNMQHNKSNSMTINSNLSHQGLNTLGSNNNTQNQLNSQNLQNTHNITNYSNLNNTSYYKKVQPKIIKNPENANSSLIHSKLPTNYIEILNKRKHEYSRNNNSSLTKDLMKVGNNTRNNVTHTHISNLTRTKLLNSSGLKELNSSNNTDDNLSGVGYKVPYNNSINRTRDNNSNTKPQHFNLISSGNNNHPQHNTFNLKNININMNISNSHSRNYNKNEISTLSDLTSSINRGNSKEDTKRKTTNVIVKPKINISFVNNINNLMASLDNVNLNPSVNFNHSHNCIDGNTGNLGNNTGNTGNSYNKKSRNGKVDSFLRNNKSSNSNNNTVNQSNGNNNNPVKNIKLHNFKTMLGNGNINSKAKSRNIKTQYSINFDTLSRGGNTYEKEVKDVDNSNPNNNNSKPAIAIKKIPRNTIDNLYGRNLSSNGSTANKKNTSSVNPKISHIKPNNQFSLNPNATFTKEKDISVLTSNYLFLKQKINNLRIGLGNITNNKCKNAVPMNNPQNNNKFLMTSTMNHTNTQSKPQNSKPKFK